MIGTDVFEIGDEVSLHNRYVSGEEIEGIVKGIAPVYSDRKRKEIDQVKSLVIIQTDGLYGGQERFSLGSFVEFKEEQGMLRLWNCNGDRYCLVLEERIMMEALS